MIEQLKTKLGPKCTAICVNRRLPGTFYQPTRPFKFCEAVNYSFREPVKLVDENLGCPGARRSLGFDNDDVALARIISENNKIPVPFIENALGKISKSTKIDTVFLGMSKIMEQKIQPDLYIVYLLPGMVTKIIHVLAKNEIQPFVSSFSLLSVCGNVFSSCYQNNRVSLSFGCPESRKSGGIAPNEVVMGFPFEIAQTIVNAV
ncbi:MAG: DUF169 domain-containing protein [Prolixibacteraceae bacterium]|nr:DUF169 domain-containing protein [Prolixibacteraceae bacterium]